MSNSLFTPRPPVAPPGGDDSPPPRRPTGLGPPRRGLALLLALTAVVGGGAGAGIVLLTGAGGNGSTTTTITQSPATATAADTSNASGLDARALYASTAAGVVDITSKGVTDSSQGSSPFGAPQQDTTATGT